MINLIATISGILGLLIIVVGIFVKQETKRDWIGIVGGLGLLAYSANQRDAIFIVLQIVFVLANIIDFELAMRNLRKKRRAKRKRKNKKK